MKGNHGKCHLLLGTPDKATRKLNALQEWQVIWSYLKDASYWMRFLKLNSVIVLFFGCFVPFPWIIKSIDSMNVIYVSFIMTNIQVSRKLWSKIVLPQYSAITFIYWLLERTKWSMACLQTMMFLSKGIGHLIIWDILRHF